MTATLSHPAYGSALQSSPVDYRLRSLLNGEISLNTRSHTNWGAAVTAQMHLPMERAIAWQLLVDYPRWVNYFPALTRSQVIQSVEAGAGKLSKRIYQTASKSFFLFTAHVDIYLKAIETTQQRIQFYLESGSFADFYADLNLQDCTDGTLLTYSVQATPTIPVPSLFIQQAIQLDLPANLKNMRQVLCS